MSDLKLTETPPVLAVETKVGSARIRTHGALIVVSLTLLALAGLWFAADVIHHFVDVPATPDANVAPRPPP